MDDGDGSYLRDELYTLMGSGGSVFDFLQQGSLDGIWYWDLEARENEWMSPRFWKILGYDPAEKKHKLSEWQELIHPDDLKVALSNFERHCEDSNHPYDQVVRYRHKDGSTVWIRCRGMVIRDAQGKPIRMLGAHTDVTPQKRAEEELREAMDRIKTLKGLIPICSYCKSIRNEEGDWQRLEKYIRHHSEAQLSHGICPSCMSEHHSEASTES